MFDVAILDTPTLLASSLAQQAAPAPGGVDVTRYLLACLIVIALLCAGAWFLARLGRGGLAARGRKRSLQVVDMLALGRKQKLCVVRAYDRTFVLGLGEREVSMVAELDSEDDLAAQALLEDGAKQAGETRSFASLVRGALGTANSIVDAARGDRSAAANTADDVAPAANVQPAPAAPSVEERAADAARQALMAILDERRDGAAPAQAPAAAAAPVRAKKTTNGAAPKRAARTTDGQAAKAEAATDAPAAPRRKVRRPAQAGGEAAASTKRRTAKRAAQGEAVAAQQEQDAPRRRVTRTLGERGERPSAEFGSGPSANTAQRRPAAAAAQRPDDGSSTWVG